jgi:N-acyl-D-amino-acid deacylase
MSLDVRIRGAQVIDGRAPADRRIDRARTPPSDLAVRGGRIVLNADPAEPAHLEIDAGGLIACPGFIDIHAHSDYAAVYAENGASKLLAGYTTELNGNCGYGAFPLAGPMRRRRSEEHGAHGLAINWANVEQYFRRCQGRPLLLNQGLLIGQGTLRGSVVGLDDTAASQAQRRAMVREVELAMRAGCFGMSTGLIYPPGCYADASEIVALAEVVAAHGGLYASHLRSESDRVVEALDEFLRVCEQTGCRAQYSHIKVAGPGNWDKLDAVRRRMDQAHDAGVELHGDRYPYTASQTDLAVMLLPVTALDGGNAAIVERLTDPHSRSQLHRFITKQQGLDHDTGWFDRVMVGSVGQADLREAEGLTLREWADRCGSDDALDAAFDLLVDDHAATQGIHFSMSEKNMRRIIGWPDVAIGSDSALRDVDETQTGQACCDRPHPRAFGTPARVLGQLVREQKLLDLDTAIYKMTGLPAKIMRLADRGLIEQGYWADLVLFDPQRIADRATYQEPSTLPAGIRWVLINGQPVVSSNGSPQPHLTGHRAGRLLRFAG